MHAMRIARGYTGREKIVKFEGQYHGVHDYALISVAPDDMSELGDEDNPVHLAWGRGIPEAVADTIIPARYNNIDFLRRLFEREGDDIAAVIVEPVLGNAQGILPQPGFHEAMRALTEEFGILLIFDEVKTGFRFARGGAAEYFGITPDLATYAKAMGNGYPVGGVRRPARDHERAARQGQPRRHVRRQPGRRRGRGQDARDHPRHGRPRDDPARPGLRLQAGLRSVLETRRACRSRSPAIPSMFGIVFTETVPDRVPRLGEHRPRAVRRGRRRHARPRRDARARQPRAVVRVRGARQGRPSSIASLEAFEGSLDAALEERAHGAGTGRQPVGAMAHPAAG